MKETTVTTGKIRISYPHLFTPQTPKNGGLAKYGVAVIIPKSDTKTLKEINAAIEAAKAIGHKDWKNGVPKKLAIPLHDGDEEKDDPAYANSYYFNCTSQRKPGIVDANLQDIIDPEEIYPGCYGRVNVNFYPYSFQGNNGIGVGLNHVQKLADGERLGNTGPSVAAAFGDEDNSWDE